MNRLIDPMITVPCEGCLTELLLDLLCANSDHMLDDAADAFFIDPFFTLN